MVGGIDNGRQENQKSKRWRSQQAESYLLITPITLANVTLNLQNSNQQALDATSFFPVGGCHWQAAWPERLSEKSDAVALQQIKERGALPMIDRGDIRQAIDRCSNIWASLPGAGYGQFEHKYDSLIVKKFKEAGGTVREIDVWAESPRLSPLWLSASSSACHGLLIITVISAHGKSPARQKCQRTEAGERGNHWHAGCVRRDVAAPDAKYEGVSWC